MKYGMICTGIFMMAGAMPAIAQWDSGSDGSDAVLDCTTLIAKDPSTDCTAGCPTGCTIEIDLSAASDASWNSASPTAGNGVYDWGEWAVVFKYVSVHIPGGVTVKFKNHESGAPVVWLVQGDVTIDGSINLDGEDSPNPSTGYDFPHVIYAAAGPGGFFGGVGRFSGGDASGGFGPGAGGPGNQGEGAAAAGGGGGHAIAGSPGGSGTGGAGGGIYGSAQILPLAGGSGGGGSAFDWSAGPSSGGDGAGGGGALLIACGNGITASTLTLNGEVSANGGRYTHYPHAWVGGGGSGGAIRMIADNVTGAAPLNANGGSSPGGGSGGDGRIRIESINYTYTGTASPAPSVETTAMGPVFVTNRPRLWISEIDHTAVTLDPEAGITTADLMTTAPAPVLITVEGEYIQPGTMVTVIVQPARGAEVRYVDVIALAGSWPNTIGGANITLPGGRSEIFLYANLTP